MKLRIRENSLRLRLSQGEVRRLRESGRVSEALRFGHGELRYELLAQPDATHLHAQYENGLIRVTLPSGAAEEWADSDRVGIRALQTVAEGLTMDLLIEKDFQCLHKREGEEDSDSFPNPEAGLED